MPLIIANQNPNRVRHGRTRDRIRTDSPRADMLHDDSSQWLWINGYAVPLDSTPLGILPGILILQRSPIVADPACPHRKQRNHLSAPEPFLQRRLPYLPYYYRLANHTNTKKKEAIKESSSNLSKAAAATSGTIPFDGFHPTL